MHIPDGMLHGQICPVTLAIGVGAVAISTYFASKIENRPSLPRFCAVASAIFVMQMLNFPISSGTSGHFLGAAFAAWALGTAPGVLAMAIIVTVQALFFGDGGLYALGANIITMALVGTAGSGLLMGYTKKGFKEIPGAVNLGLASFISVVSASVMCSVFLWISGNLPFKTLLSSMILTHIKIGLAETGITLAIMGLTLSITKSERTVIFKTVSLSIMLVAGAVISIFASELPDGLDYNAEKFGFINDSLVYFQGIMPDYVLPGLTYPVYGKIMVVITGTIIVASVSCLLKPVLQRSVEKHIQ